MVGSEIRVDINQFLPEFLELMQKVQGADVFPQTLAAFNQIAIMYQSTWRQYAGGAPIPGTPRVINSRGDYIRSIQVDLSGDTEKVVYSDSPSHRYIESGHGEVDLKPGLLSGAKAKTSKEGLPYNIVHFRHGVPGTLPSNKPMPLNIHYLMQKEERKAQQQKQTTLSQIRARNPRQYQWRARLGQAGPRRTKQTSMGSYTWKAGQYSGMVRLQTSTGRAKSSQYITFRAVSTKSDPKSWIVPAVEGIPIRQTVVDTVKPLAEELIMKALQEDLGG